jgi:uncharacterized tellurite resistance protein B-like protein
MADEQEIVLDRDARLDLLRFVCAFAWADLEIAERERSFVVDMAQKLGCDDEDLEEIESWLEVPPRPEDVDPTDIAPEHRQLALQLAIQMISADGRVEQEEVEILSLFEQLLR